MTEQEKNYSQMRKEFYQKYKNKIVPLVKMYENTRKTKLITAIILSTVLFILASFLVYFACTHGGFFEKNNEGIVKISIGIYLLSYFSWSWIKKGFENTIKEKIMPTVCSCFGKMKWSEGSYYGSEVFSASYVIQNYTSEEYDDIFKGVYKDVSIEIIEPQYEIGSGKNRRVVFDGVIVKLDMNKTFTSHTVIKPHSIMHLSPAADVHYTELEDVEFNKRFDVFTNDEVDARYLITPSFMQRLKNIKTAFQANGVNCAFFGNLLIIALPTTKDLFSICSLVKPIDDNKQYFQMYEEIVSIIKLIDHFKLNQKIGL